VGRPVVIVKGDETTPGDRGTPEPIEWTTIMPIGDKADVVDGLRGRYGAMLSQLSGDEIYAAYRAWVTAGKPGPLITWLRDTFELDPA
jgi:hypothetical protein